MILNDNCIDINIAVSLIGCLIMIFIELIYNYSCEKKIYYRSSYAYQTNYSFIRIFFNKKLESVYKAFRNIEKANICEHLLANVAIKNKFGNEQTIDIISVDKSGIIIYEVNEHDGTFIGNENDLFWKVRNNFITKKIKNPVIKAKDDRELVKSVLNIKDDSLITSYIVYNRKTNIKNAKVNPSKFRQVKRQYLNGLLRYERNEKARVLSKEEVKAYTILLEEYTIKFNKINTKKENIINVQNNGNLRYEFVEKLSNYNDLKKVWNILCMCNNEFTPALSEIKFSNEDEESSSKMPNDYYKDMIKRTFILAKMNNEVVGFVDFGHNYSIENLKHIKDNNYVITMCVDGKYRNRGIMQRLISLLEECLPEDFKSERIVIRTKENYEACNHILEKYDYKKEDFSNEFLYYTKKVDKKIKSESKAKIEKKIKNRKGI